MPAHDSAGVFFPGFETKDIWNGRRTSDLNKLKEDIFKMQTHGKMLTCWPSTGHHHRSSWCSRRSCVKHREPFVASVLVSPSFSSHWMPLAWPSVDGQCGQRCRQGGIERYPMSCMGSVQVILGCKGVNRES